MWKWDQGRLEYFQFDELRKIARFAAEHDLRLATHEQLISATGLPFSPNAPSYRPWRNYGRVFQLAMIVVPKGKHRCEITEIGKLLADDGKITTDEYLHFLAQATTDPSPALRQWGRQRALPIRFPLLFSLRFLLARASQGEFTTSIKDIVSAYAHSHFRGDEDQAAFLKIIYNDYPELQDIRQSSESIKVLAQISYLSVTSREVTVSLAKEDAQELFDNLCPMSGEQVEDPGEEILRIASRYPNSIADLRLQYPATVISNTVEAGFSEGGRVKRTHLTLERNSRLREAFFAAKPGATCDFCSVNTNSKYPWTTRILEVHHLLPLCSGARTKQSGTVIDDLVANCPTCHRAVHKYYDHWLKKNGKADFIDAKEARCVYDKAKRKYQKN